MSGNTFGKIFKVTTFGESHGEAIGAVVDGCPAGIPIDGTSIQCALDRRRPGGAVNGIQTAAVTLRNERDQVEVLSGVFNGRSLGTPIALLIRNTQQHSADYANLERTFRPAHADFTYDAKYGFRDHRGGGRSSGRESAARVAAGAIASAFIATAGINVTAYTLRAAGIGCSKIDLRCIEENAMRAPDNEAAALMQEAIERLRQCGDSCGGVIECIAHPVPAGLGEPVFDKLDAEIAKSVLSIGAVKGIEFGAGFAAADMTGSEHNDALCSKKGEPFFVTNHAGGILGGISNGKAIVFRAAIKPVPSIGKNQKTVKKDGDTYCDTDIAIRGRHDTCLCPRMVPVIEAMTSLVLADMLLQNRAARL